MAREKHLTIYRRHVPDCKEAAAGVRSTQKCDCPCWVIGPLPDGRMIRRTLGTRDWSRALRIVDLLDRGGMTVAPVERRSLQDGIAAFLANCKRRALAPGTLHNYETTLGYLASALGNKAAADVTAEDIAAWNASRRTPDGTPLAPRTSAKELTFTRMLFGFLRNREWITKNVASLVKPPRQPAEGATLPFSAFETRKILAGVDTYQAGERKELTMAKLRALVPLLLHSGLRISDAAALKRSDIDWKSHYLIRRQQKTGAHVKIKLPEDVIVALDALPESLFADIGDTATSTVRKLSGLLERLGDHVGIHVTPHRFRDAFAVELLTAGADIRSVQMLLGHSSVRVTEKAYARFTPAQQALLDAATAKLSYDAAEPIAIDAAR